MRFLVMGAGSMGSVVGGFLAKAGHAVTLLGRDPFMAAIREHGLRITGIWGDHHVTNFDVRIDTAGLSAGDFDVILVTVKSYDTGVATEIIAPLVDDNTLVCAYQNGLGNAETIAARIGWARTIGARVIFGTWISEPGAAKVTVIANPTEIGPYTEATPKARVHAIVEAMDAAGVPTLYTETIATVLWGKVAYNSALNPLSALLDVPYGVLAEAEHTRAIMREVIVELYAVARAMNVPLDPDTAEAYLELFFGKLIPPTAAHYASMREDFRQQRRTEIDALNGAICRFGREHGIPCPTNETLTRLVLAREYALGVRY
ncbi:MAG TPA: ketopantoate reductase family protein [Candidatus Hydrogenedentes bacterium]|nr:ketopantoate reductase family protein [Candidatus Hydrogenedentota bacterium]HPG67431.1 ketopantoate reductase family protein [Candidatus Hydrogenedentota bacterium]